MTIKRQLEKLQKSFQDAKEETGHKGPSRCCHDVPIARTVNLVEILEVPIGKTESTEDPEGVEDEVILTRKERRYNRVVASGRVCGKCLKPVESVRIESEFVCGWTNLLWNRIVESGNYFVERLHDGTLALYNWDEHPFIRAHKNRSVEDLTKDAAKPVAPDFKRRASGEEQEPLPYEPGCDEGMM